MNGQYERPYRIIQNYKFLKNVVLSLSRTHLKDMYETN